MKSIVVFFLPASIWASSCNNSASESAPADPAEKTKTAVVNPNPTVPPKYKIKSGAIFFETVAKMGNFDSKTKSVVYFDDYGLKERKDSYDETGNLKESFFSDGKTLYLLIHNDKTAFKRGNAYRGTEFKFDWNELPANDKETGKAKKGENETILGKDCEVFYHETKHGKMKYAGWQNICLLMDLESPAVKSKTIAREIKEEPVNADMFVVPPAYTIQ